MHKITVYDSTGKKTGSVDVALTQPEQNASKAYAVSVRRLLQHGDKELLVIKLVVRLITNKKPWRQKGLAARVPVQHVRHFGVQVVLLLDHHHVFVQLTCHVNSVNFAFCIDAFGAYIRAFLLP